MTGYHLPCVILYVQSFSCSSVVQKLTSLYVVVIVRCIYFVLLSVLCRLASLLVFWVILRGSDGCIVIRTWLFLDIIASPALTQYRRRVVV